MKSPAVIYDLDNTLADVSHLVEYLIGNATDYDLFHELAANAKPIDWVVCEMKKWSPTHLSIVVTARQEKFRQITSDWMMDNEIPYDELWMRPTGDVRSDYEFKKDALGHIQGMYEVVKAYDDNPHTLKLWLENGIPTTVVPGWPMKEWP